MARLGARVGGWGQIRHIIQHLDKGGERGCGGSHGKVLGANILRSFELNDDGLKGEAALGGDFGDNLVHVSILTEVECGEVREGSHEGGCRC